MKSLIVPHLKGVSSDSSLSAISLQLDNVTKQKIGYTPWADYTSKPNVSFSIAYSDDCLLLKYEVEEKTIRAVNTIINSPVYEDSCVEFFIGFDDTGYYNFEFNCIGNRLAEFGKGKKGRELLPEVLLKKIKSQAVVIQNGDRNVSWQLTVVILLEIFIHHRLSALQDKQCRANFCKCGDLLPEPHFVTWSNIESDEPNFHLPEFFGTVVFE